MTVFELLNVVRRRWWVVAIGAVATLMLTWNAYSTSGIYLGQVNVILAPPYYENSNVLTSANASLIATAGVVSAVIRGMDSGAEPVSDGVSLGGEGIYDGFSIRQPNPGGQWQFTPDQPVLNVQAAGTTLEGVQANMATALNRIDGALSSLQDQAGVSRDSQIRTVLSPAQPNYVSEGGSRSRAMAASLALGILCTLSFAVFLDRKRLKTPAQIGPLLASRK